MNTHQRDRVDEVFDLLLDVPAEKRYEELHRLCAKEEKVCHEVELLLSALQSADRKQLLAGEPLVGLTNANRISPKAGHFTGCRFDQYELQQLLGIGGMGAVYKAVVVNDSQQVVAIKILRQEWADEHRFLARFHAEREVLAQLNHPNIAQLLDGGTTPDGLPYYVMEYVKGQPLHTWCQEQAPSTDILTVISQICNALQQAHSRGIVHRDLKPGNILIDERGQPKILDFGLAKRLLDTEETIARTRTGSFLGTPGYMAPEQIEGRIREITPATDVFVLGIVLYQLLTGRAPFESATPHLAAHLVCKQDPIPPRHLNRNLSRDLNLVCLTCLHKEPSRRYEDAQALAEELHRVQSGQPPLARPTPIWSTCARWAWHNKALAALVILLLLIASVGFPGALWLWQRAEYGQQQALEAQKKAEQTRLDGLKLSRDTLSELISGGIFAETKFQKTYYKQLMNLKNYLEDLDNKKTDVRVKRELGLVYCYVGYVDQARGSRKKALRSYNKGSKYLKPLLAIYPKDKLMRRRLASCYNNSAVLYINIKAWSEAKQALEQAITVSEQSVHLDKNNWKERRNLQAARYNLAEIYIKTGLLDEAAVLLKVMIRELQSLIRQYPRKVTVVVLQAECMGLQAELYEQQGNLLQAKSILENALLLQSTPQQFDLTPNNQFITWYMRRSLVLFRLGRVLQKLEHPAKALDLLTQSYTLQSKVVKQNPPLTRERRLLAETCLELVVAYQQQGKSSLAKNMLKQVQDQLAILHQRGHNDAHVERLRQQVQQIQTELN